MRDKTKYISESDQEMHCRPTHGTIRKSNKTITITGYQKDNKSKPSNSLFPIKMTSKQERTQNIAVQSKENTSKSPQWDEDKPINQQQQKHRLRMANI